MMSKALVKTAVGGTMLACRLRRLWQQQEVEGVRDIPGVQE